MRRLVGAWLLFILILFLKSDVLFRSTPDIAGIPEATSFSENGETAGRTPLAANRNTPHGKPSVAGTRYSSNPSRAEVDSAGRKLLFFFSTAPRDSLILLPGIGPVLADRIINARNGKRLFDTWDDLRAIKGIGPKKVEKLKRLAVAE